MAIKTGKMQIIVSLKDQFSKGFKNVGKSIDGVKSRLFGLKGAVVGLGLGVVAKQLMDIASEQDKAVVGMETALRSMGVYSKETSESLQMLASDIQGFTNYGDEAILMGQKFLVTYQNIGAEVLPRASRAMVDLAALMGGDMKTAANMLGKASMGMTGQLSLAGIQVKKTTFESEGFLGILGEIEAQSKGQARAQREATGSMTAMGNSFGDLKEKGGSFLKLLLEPGFQMFLNWFDDLNEKITKLQKEGKFEEYARSMASTVLDKFEVMALGTINFYGVMAPIMKNFKGLFSEIWDWFKTLPSWVQTSGLALSIVGGKNVKLTLLTFGALSKGIEAVQDELKLMTFEFTEGRSELKNYTLLLETLEIQRKKLSKGSIFGTESEAEFEKRKKELEEVNRRIGLIHKKIKSLTPGKLFDEKEEEKTIDSTINIAKSKLLAFTEELRKRVEETTKVKPEELGVPTAAPAVVLPEKEQMKKDLEILKALSQTQLLELQTLYGESLITFRQYWDERREMINAQYQAELMLFRKTAELERDPLKKAAAESAAFSKEEEYRRASLQLTLDEATATEDTTRKKIELGQMLLDLQLRAAESLTAIHAVELAEMDARHATELDHFETLLDDKLAAEQGYIDEAAALRDIDHQQQLEKEKLLAEQKKAINLQRLSEASKITTGLKDIANQLYEMSGKSNKKLFKLTKAAAIASAIVNGAEAVVRSLKEGGPIMGPIMAGITAALVGIQVAKIQGTEMGGSFAEGGLIPGSSPHSKADNVQINATAGEYMQPVPSVKYYGKKVMDGIKNLAFPKEMFSGFSLPSFASVSGVPKMHYAEGGVVTALPKIKAAQPKIEIVNVTNPDAIRGLALDAVHENRDIVVNMVLQGLEDRNITLQRNYP